jgi:hypothetical protein
MKTIVAVAALVFGTGCIADQMTFEPLLTEADRVVESAIAGTWSSEDADDPFVAAIRPVDGDYELVPLEDGRALRPLAIRLGRIGGQLYWDAAPSRREDEGGPAEDQLLPLHSIARVTLCGDRLLVSPLRSDWVEAALADGRLETPHVLIDGDPVLSGSSAELRLLVAEHAGDEGAFGDSGAASGCDAAAEQDALVLHRVAAAS